MHNKLLKSWFVTLLFILCGNVFANNVGMLDSVRVSNLPVEAQQTLSLIKQGGPFPYAKDGAVFGNYEGVLPRQRRGYYHEYTVRTPYARNRGARRIIAGGNVPSYAEYYYTADHYQTFQRIKE